MARIMGHHEVFCWLGMIHLQLLIKARFSLPILKYLPFNKNTYSPNVLPRVIKNTYFRTPCINCYKFTFSAAISPWTAKRSKLADGFVLLVAVRFRVQRQPEKEVSFLSQGSFLHMPRTIRKYVSTYIIRKVTFSTKQVAIE